MKATTRNTLIVSIGLAFGFVGLLGPLFGFPDWTLVFYAAFPIALWLVIWLQRRAKRRGDPSFVPATPAQNRQYTWLLLLGFFAACVASPFVLPYAGITLPFWALVIISLVTFVVLALPTVVVRRRREKA
jgi:hypothetical protein